MAKWVELLPALKQTLNSSIGTPSSAENTGQRNHGVADQEPVLSDIAKTEKRKRLIDVITEVTLRGAL